MIELVKRTLDRGLEWNERAAASAVNGFDWLFRRDNLVKSGQTEYELVYESDLMSVRYYGLDGVDAVPLADGTMLPIQRRQHVIPLVLVPPLGMV